MKTLGDRIRFIRGMTSQVQFAASLEIAQTKLSRYERNTTVPDLEFLVRLSQKYSVSLEWLITGNASRESPQTLGEAAEGLNADGHADEASSMLSVPALQQELAMERMERRELTAENRKLHQEKEALLRENGELREKVARLEERKNPFSN